MDASLLDVRHIPLVRSIVEGESQPSGALEKRVDYLGPEASGDAIGPLADVGHGEIAGLILSRAEAK